MCWTVTNAGQSEEKHMGEKFPIHTSFILEGIFQMMMQRNSFCWVEEKDQSSLLLRLLGLEVQRKQRAAEMEPQRPM